MLVHAGFGHIEEVVGESFYPMAVYFREITGIDPLTVDQVTMTAESEAAFENPLRQAAEEAGLLGDAPAILLGASGEPLAPVDYDVDLQVFAPRTAHPAALIPGRTAATLLAPEACALAPCLVEVWQAGDADDAIPLDRQVVDHAEPFEVVYSGPSVVRVRAGETGEVLMEQTLPADE